MNPDLTPLINDLPTPLALLLEEYAREQHPYIKLHRLIDTAEIVTRFLFITTIVDAFQKLTPFPTELSVRLAKELPRPSFGKWSELLTLTLQTFQKRKQVCFVPALPELWTQVWRPLIGRNANSYRQALLPLRNHVAHVGRITDDVAQELLGAIQNRFETACQRLAILREWDLVAITHDGTGHLLRGPQKSGRLETYPYPIEGWQPGRVYLSAGSTRRSLELFPLYLYNSLLGESGTTAGSNTEAAPMLYLSYNPDQKRLEYTVFAVAPASPHFWRADGDPLHAFLNKFDPEHWEQEQREREHMQREQQNIHETITAWGYGFEDLPSQYPDLAELYGREQHLRAVHGWIQEHLAPGGGLWIGGAPGVGKSAFMCGLWQRIRSDTKHKILLIPFFFRAGDIRCAPEHFYRSALLSLGQKPELNNAVGETQPLETQLRAMLQRHVERSGRPIVFLLDGIDEVSSAYPGFLSQVLELALPGVVWVCAGRGALPDVVAGLWDAHPLEALTAQEVRTWLVHDLERLKYALFDRDALQSDGSFRNAFIDALVRHSEGLPLYITMALEDLKVGQITTADEAKLPQSLSGYYAQLLERLKVGDVAVLLTDVLALLSWAVEPLTEAQIGAILAPHHAADAADWPGLVAQALKSGAMLLRKAFTPEQIWGWTLYHDAFREHLRASPMVTAARRRTQRLLLAWCKTEATNRHPYALRQYAWHLREQGDWELLRQLMTVSVEQAPWAELRYDLERRYGGYLEDLAALEHHAQTTQDWELQIECALIRSSIRDASQLAPELLVALVTIGVPQGKWAFETVLDYLPRMAPQQQGETLRLFAQQALPDLPRERIRTLIDNLPEADVQDDLLKAFGFLPEAQPTVKPPTQKLLQLPEDFRTVLAELEAEADENTLANKLWMIVRRFNVASAPAWSERLCSLVLGISDPAWRGRVLTGLLDQGLAADNPTLIQAALDATLSTTYDFPENGREFSGERIRLPEDPDGTIKAVFRITDKYQRVEALAALYPQFVKWEWDYQFRDFQQLLDRCWNTVNRAREFKTRALLALLKYLDDENRQLALQQALEAALLMEDYRPEGDFYVEDSRYLRDVDRLPAEFMGSWYLEWDPPFVCLGKKMALLIDLAHFLTEAQRALLPPLVAKELHAQRRIEDTNACLAVLTHLAQHLSADELAQTLFKVRQVAQPDIRAPMLLRLAPYLPLDEGQPSFEEAIEALYDYDQWDANMVSWQWQIAPHLSPALALIMLKQLHRVIDDPCDRGDVLEPLLPHLVPAHQAEVLAVIREFTTRTEIEFFILALATALPYLPESERPGLLIEGLGKLSFEPDMGRRRLLLLALSAFDVSLKALASGIAQSRYLDRLDRAVQPWYLGNVARLLRHHDEPLRNELAQYLYRVAERAGDTAVCNDLTAILNPPATPPSLHECWEPIAATCVAGSRAELLKGLKRFILDATVAGAVDRDAFTRVIAAIAAVRHWWP